MHLLELRTDFSLFGNILLTPNFNSKLLNFNYSWCAAVHASPLKRCKEGKFRASRAHSPGGLGDAHLHFLQGTGQVGQQNSLP